MKSINILSYPYDDEKLKFNERTSRYELTVQFCKEQFDSTFKDDAILERRIKLNTQTVYNFIYSRVASVNKPVVSFLLNRSVEGREFILELLTAQMYADVQTGYNDLLYQPAVNFNGQDKDRMNIQLNAVCVATEQIFNSSDNYFGIRLAYQAQFPYAYFLLVRNNS